MPIVKLDKSRLTYRDVARIAGVAPATVSRVLNKSTKVAPGTRDRVLAAIKDTGYKPMFAARMLARQRHETIGLIFEKEHVKTYYGAGLIEGLAEALTEKGLHLALNMISWDGTPGDLGRLPILETRSVDGLVLDVAQLGEGIAEIVAESGLPAVFVNPTEPMEHNAIVPDDLGASRMATEYLIGKGHTKIGYMPCYRQETHHSQRDRMKGYVETMTAAGLEPMPRWDCPPKRILGPRTDYHERLDLYRIEYGATAIVAYSMIEAIPLAFACSQLGLSIPGDVELVGCDYDPSIQIVPVQIPCVYLDRAKMGRIAIEMLLRCIENPKEDIPSYAYRGEFFVEPRDWYRDGTVGGELISELEKS